MSHKHEAKWLEKFYELLRFTHIHGHTNVSESSQEFRKLGTWVQVQRRYYKLKIMEPARIELLTLINFKFRLKLNTERPGWNAMFNRLIQFKQEFGHINVTKNDKQLYAWLRSQRMRFKSGKLKSEEFSRLVSVGFVLNLRDINWNSQFQKLVSFKKQYGHLDVCPKYTNDQELLRFVHWMRFIKNKLPTDRLKKLEKLGFLWQKEYSAWMEHYEKLKAFKTQHGHFHLPKEDAKFRQWINHQRCNKNLPEKRFNLLAQIGFFDKHNI